jgi:hypothetical protein
MPDALFSHFVDHFVTHFAPNFVLGRPEFRASVLVAAC